MTDAATHPTRARRAFPSSGREKAFAKAQRHSRLVRVLKVVLPAAAFAVAASFVGYSMISSAGIANVDLGMPSIENGNLVMSNPKLDGFTSDNLPYEMTAARATQALGGSSAIHLEMIRAQVPMNADTEATIEAAKGILDRESNTLDINSPLTLTTTSGIVARLQSAAVDINAKELSTDDPVKVNMKGTRIAANSLETAKGGKVFVFKDRVSVTIEPSRLKQARAAAGGSETDE